MSSSHTDARFSRRSRIDEMTAEQAFFLAREYFFSRLSTAQRLAVPTFAALLQRAVAGGHEEAEWMLDVMKRSRYSSQQDLSGIVTCMKALLTSARNKDTSPRGLYHRIKYLMDNRLSDVDLNRLRESAEGG